MEKMKLSNNQVAFEYVIYLVASTYFENVKCKNQLFVQRLYIQYKEQKEENRVKMDKFFDEYMEKIVTKLPEDLFTLETDIHFVPRPDQTTEIQFENEKYMLRFVSKYNPRKPEIKCFLSTKN